MVNFWCQFTCSPNQSSFVDVLGIEKKPDPGGAGMFTVLHTSAAVSKTFACGVFQSCQDTSKVKENPVLQNCESFFIFQGETEAITTGNMFIDFNYTGNATAAGTVIDQPLFSCCNFNLSLASKPPLQPLPPPAYGAPNVSCPCASCRGMCAGGSCGATSQDLPDAFDGNTLKGFNAVTVGAFWGTLLVVGATVLVSRRMLGCEKRPLAAVERGSCEAGGGTATEVPAKGGGTLRDRVPRFDPRALVGGDANEPLLRGPPGVSLQ